MERMKIIRLLFLSLTFTFFNLSLAQETQDKDSYFGVKIGANSSNLSGESTKDKEGRETDVTSRVGFYAGGFYHHQLSDKLSFQPELLFSYQGASIDIKRWEALPVTAGSDIDLPYILLPLMLQYELFDNFSLEVGPQLGYNLGKFIIIKGKVVLNGETFLLEDRLEDVARWDFSVLAGAGYSFNENFTVKFRFAKGLNSLDQRKQDAFTLYNQVFSLGLEYNFK